MIDFVSMQSQCRRRRRRRHHRHRNQSRNEPIFILRRERMQDHFALLLCDVYGDDADNDGDGVLASLAAAMVFASAISANEFSHTFRTVAPLV